MKKLVLAIAVSASATASLADVAVGGVSGLVTATNGGQFFNVQSGMTLPDGVQLSVPAGSSINVSMPGCSTTVVGAQTVSMTLANCQAIQQAAAAGGGTGSGGAVNTNYLIAGGAGLGLLAYNIDRNRGNGATPPVAPPVVTTPPTTPVATTPRPVRRPSRS